MIYFLDFAKRNLRVVVSKAMHVASRPFGEMSLTLRKSRWAKILEMKGTAYLFTSAKKIYKL